MGCSQALQQPPSQMHLEMFCLVSDVDWQASPCKMKIAWDRRDHILISLLCYGGSSWLPDNVDLLYHFFDWDKLSQATPLIFASYLWLENCPLYNNYVFDFNSKLEEYKQTNK